MATPDWFTLIQQWREKGMGEYGITLPFLVGALARKTGESSLNANHVREALDLIIKSPVDGYVTEVRLCAAIDAPVFTVTPLNSATNQMIHKSSFVRPSGEGTSLGFSTDLHSEYGGLGCSDADECFEKLINHAAEHVQQGHFSKYWSETENNYIYGEFQAKDLEFIKEVLM